VHYLGRLAAALCFGLLASCGGSSSETPPPLEPLPVNVHYNRSATTLPGELGNAVKPTSTAEPEEAPEEEPGRQAPAEPATNKKP
jgi:hypothetical protein